MAALIGSLVVEEPVRSQFPPPANIKVEANNQSIHHQLSDHHVEPANQQGGEYQLLI